MTAEHAIAAGMTEREAETWMKVSAAAGSYLRLTEDEHHHPMEREEVCHAFHVIQGWLCGRPFVRALAEAHKPCGYCNGRGWVEDENWSPEHEGEMKRGRVPGSGLIPCVCGAA